MEYISIIIQIILAYGAAVIAPLITIYVLERRSLEELEATRSLDLQER